MREERPYAHTNLNGLVGVRRLLGVDERHVVRSVERRLLLILAHDYHAASILNFL